MDILSKSGCKGRGVFTTKCGFWESIYMVIHDCKDHHCTMISGWWCCVNILSKSDCDRNEFEPTLPRTLSCIVVLFLNPCTHVLWLLCCSFAHTIRMSLQHNVQRWHLAERPPHLNFLSFSLLLTINYCQCATLYYSVVSVSVSVCRYVWKSTFLKLSSFVSVLVIFLSVLQDMVNKYNVLCSPYNTASYLFKTDYE